MKKFMDEDFLLSTETAKKLYHDYAAKMPIIDYHCHINPQEIAEDRQFENITQVWLAGDHYKWRQMRTNGVYEYFITGAASDREKFQKWAETLERAIGNPLYHWSHLELRTYFGYKGDLNAETAEEVWNLCNEKLQSTDLSVRKIIEKSKVSMIGTTDDPIDNLFWHEKILKDSNFQVKVLPTWRPDKAMCIKDAGFADYIDKLTAATGISITSFSDYKKALRNRLDFFEKHGCCNSDHGLVYIPYHPTDEQTINKILKKGLRGENISLEEEEQFKTESMLFLGEEYAKRNWVMQLHFGAARNNNAKSFKKMGPDTGFDSIYNNVPIEQLTGFMDALDSVEKLPKTVLYSLNPNDNAAIGTLIGCFQGSAIRGKIQQGSAWWFNDHIEGMTSQMENLANLGLLANFIGMLTDSRSFLSYTRHEYFRRILCELIGNKIENGEFPADEIRVGKIVQDISYNNAKNYFGL